MIINIRGTHGSGKSTAVRLLLDTYPHVPLPNANVKRPEGYQVAVPWLKRLVMVVGPYHTACGGCDAVQPCALVFNRVEEYAKGGHVVFEGALVSQMGIARVERYLGLYQDGYVTAVMDTPLDECLRRIGERRKARGDDRPLDPKNTTVKHRSITNAVDKVRGLGGRIVALDHRKTFVQLLTLLKDGDRADL